jgi:acyl-CoA hydrolase/GNAT superfamily N-acetyltransferase
MSQDWQHRYASKIEPAQRAVRRIGRGARVFIGSGCGEPQALVRAMVEASGSMADTELIHICTLGVAPYSDPKYASNFRPNAFFIGNSLRDAVSHARADYTPAFLSQVPSLFRSSQLPLDVALITISPPDEHGFASLGVSVDITRAAVDTAQVVIAQVNSFMPHTLGDAMVHLDQIDVLVDQSEPLLEWPPTQPDDLYARIGTNIARLVPDGATLQIGVGHIPDAVLSALDDKNDLGIHTGMFSDGVMRLARKGVITGKCKTLHPGKIIGSFALGTRELFDWMNDNKSVEMHPADYTNDPSVICRNNSMVSINAALEVDLTGQAVADSLGQRFYTGLGGAADFIRGAAMAKNGKAIIALPSTLITPEGPRSRITSALSEGADVVASRGDASYVVTEYGVAYLHGRSLRERAMSLISISHPDFRSELLHAAKRRHLVYPDQIIPPASKPYPAKYEETVTLPDGMRLFIRPIRPDDEPRMKDMFYSFSEQTVYLRYHGILKTMPHNKLQVFCNVDYDTEMALVAAVGQPGQEEIIGVGRYMTDAAKASAELAFAVQDGWQRKGIGTHLFKRLIAIAQEHGIRKLHADVLVENSGMLKIFHRSGLRIQTTTDAGVVRVRMAVSDPKTSTQP